MENDESINDRSPNLLLYIIIQLLAAGSLITNILLYWWSSYLVFFSLPHAIPLIIVPLEGAAIVLALLTFRSQQCYQMGAWILVAFFRIVVAIQLLFIPWSYFGFWPPEPGAPYQVLIASPFEFVFGVVTILWFYSLRTAFTQLEGSQDSIVRSEGKSEYET